MEREKPKLGTHVIALFDFLGFSSIVGNQVAQGEILELLSDVAASRGNFSVDIKDTGGGSRTTTVTPSISAFSDHMVISFETAELQKANLDTFFALALIRNTAGHLALRARELKCLIRGAITLGPLYHSDGVIFGDGLVRAHMLESTIAVYPRVIISPDVLASSAQQDWTQLSHHDADGWDCLEYMKAMLEDMDLYAYGTELTAEARNNRSIWARLVRAKAYEEGNRLEADAQLRPAQNWRWFARRFEAAMHEVNGHRFNENGAPLDFLDSYRGAVFIGS